MKKINQFRNVISDHVNINPGQYFTGSALKQKINKQTQSACILHEKNQFGSEMTQISPAPFCSALLPSIVPDIGIGCKSILYSLISALTARIRAQ